MEPQIVVGLPAYNEEAGIARLLDRIIAVRERYPGSLDILIVNDGSADKTPEVLQEYREHYEFVDYINHPRNLGLGRAINTILHAAAERYPGEAILVTMDADNTHNPEIIPAMAAQLVQEQMDIIIASRFTRGGQEIGLSALRKVFSRGARLFCRVLFPIAKVTDYSCGFRAYRIAYLQEVMAAYDGELVSSSGFECMVEILARCGKYGVKADEYPLVLEYNLKEGASKMRVARTIGGYFALARTIKPPRKEHN